MYEQQSLKQSLGVYRVLSKRSDFSPWLASRQSISFCLGRVWQRLQPSDSGSKDIQTLFRKEIVGSRGQEKRNGGVFNRNIVVEVDVGTDLRCMEVISDRFDFDCSRVES